MAEVDKPNPPGPGRLPEPVVAKRRRWAPSLIWLIPIVAALVGVSLVVKLLTERGPTITISFRSAEGIEAGKTRLKYKDVEIGNVQSVKLAEDRSRVIADGYKQALVEQAGLAVDGWVRGVWRYRRDRLTVTLFERLTDEQEAAVRAEGAELLTFLGGGELELNRS